MSAKTADAPTARYANAADTMMRRARNTHLQQFALRAGIMRAEGRRYARASLGTANLSMIEGMSDAVKRGMLDHMYVLARKTVAFGGGMGKRTIDGVHLREVCRLSDMTIYGSEAGLEPHKKSKRGRNQQQPDADVAADAQNGTSA